MRCWHVQRVSVRLLVVSVYAAISSCTTDAWRVLFQQNRRTRMKDHGDQRWKLWLRYEQISSCCFGEEKDRTEHNAKLMGVIHTDLSHQQLVSLVGKETFFTCSSKGCLTPNVEGLIRSFFRSGTACFREPFAFQWKFTCFKHHSFNWQLIVVIVVTGMGNGRACNLHGL